MKNNAKNIDKVSKSIRSELLNILQENTDIKMEVNINKNSIDIKSCITMKTVGLDEVRYRLLKSISQIYGVENERD